MTLGRRLAFYRKKSCLTQQQLGKMINVSAQAVSKWENDLAEPDVATICKLAPIYQISPDALLTGRESTAPLTATPQRSTEHRLRLRWMLVSLAILLTAAACGITLTLFADNTAMPTLPSATRSIHHFITIT